MSREHVSHRQIQSFSDKVVNLTQDHARKYREQVNRLRDKLEDFITENPDFELKKMLLSGSLAKRTALRTLNDADVAVYVESAPENVGDIADWLAEKLRKAFPNFKDDQVVVQNYSVKVEFKGTGLDIDVVPVYIDEGDRGFLVSREDGTKLKTNITRHKEFIAARRKNYQYYAQVVRLLKWWVKRRKEENTDFKFKSFMVELILAHLFDNKDIVYQDDYPEILLAFFDYIAKYGFREEIRFDDYNSGYSNCYDPIRIIDPVNSQNNVARGYSEADRQTIVEKALEAGDSIDAALKAPTKEQTMRYWRDVFGPTFKF